ncbi:DnaJ domain-containing protein, partial [Baffinella frigidus]
YDVLGVPSTATPGDIRKAYMALALQHHPDKGWKGADEGGGDDKFNAVQEAYEVLSDPVRRCAHDNY